MDHFAQNNLQATKAFEDGIKKGKLVKLRG